MERDARLVRREAELVAGWLRSAPQQVTCSDGAQLQVVFRGVAGVGPGPDVREAILATESGRLLRGDIEFHRREAGWNEHGHGADRRYDGVVLHIVESLGAARAGDAPVAKWSPPESDRPHTVRLGGMPRLSGDCPLLLAAASGEIGDFLERLAGQRLARKALLLEADCDVLGVNQAVYSRLLQVLGYSRNRGAMARLAAAAPIGSLEPLSRGRELPTARQRIAAQLIGSAGLAAVAEASPDAEVRAAVATRLPEPQLAAEGWDRTYCRPQNLPERRLLAAGALLESGIDRLRERLESVATDRSGVARLISMAGGRMGEARAVQMAVDLVAPYKKLLGRDSSAEASRRLPATMPGKVARLAGAIRELEPQFTVASALEEQALLEYYDRHCARRPCWNCLRY